MNDKSNLVNENKNVSSKRIRKAFAKTLKDLRFEKGLTQHDLEERSGLSLRMISDLERGVTQPSLVTLFKLTKGLDISLMKLSERLINEMGKK